MAAMQRALSEMLLSGCVCLLLAADAAATLAAAHMGSHISMQVRCEFHAGMQRRHKA